MQPQCFVLFVYLFFVLFLMCLSADDCNRVRLSSEDDYINASHITVNIDGDQLHYIACQGPLPFTTDDFWRMIWDQQSNVIAMVSLDVEANKVKCYRYWPDTADIVLSVCNEWVS